MWPTARTSRAKSSQPRLYLAIGGSTNVVTLIIRTPGRPEALIPGIKRAMADLNADVPTFGEVTPVDLREQRMQQERLLTTLLLAFGAVALLLSSIGIYGMLAYLVTRRMAKSGSAWHLALVLGMSSRWCCASR